MKRILKNKLLTCVLGCLALSATQETKADITDWVTNQIESYIQDEINQSIGSILNSTNSYLGPIGSWLWDNVVSSVTESSMKESAQKFANYQPDYGPLNRLRYKYSNSYLWGNYNDIYRTQNEFTKQVAFSVHDVRFKDLAGGTTLISHQVALDSLNGVQHQITSQLIPISVQNYLDTLPNDRSEIIRILPTELESNYRMTLVVRNHPEALGVYENSFLAPSLRNNSNHLMHWSVNADNHISLLPKKTKLINPRAIEFKEVAGNINMLYDNKIIATANKSEGQIECKDIELLNLMPYPNTVYTFNSIDYVTDNLGRVVNVTQSISKDEKGKCSSKSKFKAKKTATLLGNEEVNAYYPLGYLSYQAPETLINTAFYFPSKENKTTVKNIQKALKRQLKYFGQIKIFSDLVYSDGSRIPSEIIVKVANETFTILNTPH